MATNENGHLIDDAGNVVIDHVWGNMPPQPNDVRLENGGGLLDEDLSFHGRLLAGWNGYPLYTPNDAGETPPNLVVPSVVGLDSVAATRILVDAGFNSANVSEVEASNYSQKVRRIGVSSGVASIQFDSDELEDWYQNGGLSVGDTITITGLTQITGPVDVSGLNGTHTVTGFFGVDNRIQFATAHGDVPFNTTVGNQTTNTSWVSFDDAEDGLVIAQTPAAGADNQTASSTVEVVRLYTTDPDA